jgi:hypothetical protein
MDIWGIKIEDAGDFLEPNPKIILYLNTVLGPNIVPP